MVDSGAGAVDIGGGGELVAEGFGFGGEGEADAVLVAGIADGADAELEDFGPTGAPRASMNSGDSLR